MIIKISYDGEYPNLCRGELIVTIDGVVWKFPEYCLSSNGSVTFDENWCKHVSSGNWSIDEWPKNFPTKLKNAVVDAVNSSVPHGCCGGCV